MSLDGSVMPDLFPEFGRFRHTPLPEIIVVLEGDVVLLADEFLEFVYLRFLWRRGAPQLLRGRAVFPICRSHSRVQLNPISAVFPDVD